jgi:heat shock protein HslJ
MCGLFLLSCAPVRAGEIDLPASLFSPDRAVVCHKANQICFDRFGPSIGLTEVFLGQTAAQRLTATLREHPLEQSQGARFSLDPGVDCILETGPCRVAGDLHAGLTMALFGPWPPRATEGAEAAAIIGVEWKWAGSRYNNDTNVRPSDPSRFRLRLVPGGLLDLQADCNAAGGGYRIEGRRITITVTHSTMAACEPDSMDRIFLKDLDAAGGWFVREGRLYLNLALDSGTMEFDR